MTRTLAIVGAKFRPPAAGLLAVLPSGAALSLVREPGNPYDSNAIAVYVSRDVLRKLPAVKLDDAIVGYGTGYAALMMQERWHLGYVPRTESVMLAPLMDSAQTPTLPGELMFTASGQASVRADFPGRQETQT